MKNKSKYFYLYLCISTKYMSVIKGKLLHAQVFESKEKANKRVLKSKKLHEGYHHVGLRYKVLTFKIN